jgi:hypothetical protein
MERWNYITIGGQTYTYDYRKSWGKILYSFDNGETWADSKRKAFEGRTYQAILGHKDLVRTETGNTDVGNLIIEWRIR